MFCRGLGGGGGWGILQSCYFSSLPLSHKGQVVQVAQAAQVAQVGEVAQTGQGGFKRGKWVK